MLQLKSGKPKDTPEGAEAVTLVLWPEHNDTLTKWARAHKCSRSEAARLILDLAGDPKSQRARNEMARVRRERDELRRANSPPEADRLAAMRARWAVESRNRRARAKAKAKAKGEGEP